ncbi:MAG TPA: hypothetical protein VM939_09240 [Gemmatimonadaceae bacterium]|nr:hypothetical protein [Gemmatimonadaceae bacterium]
MMRFSSCINACATAIMLATVPATLGAQWSTTHEQTYMPGPFNWEFRQNYPGADRLFNAFDYGHAILYERLWTRPNAPARDLEEKEFDFITRRLLVNPPDLPLEEAAIEIAYARMAPEAKMMFEWAHLFHRQIYDVWADERIPVAQKDAKVQELIRYYKTRKDLAFSSVPKNMELMEGQPYSLAFRNRYPKFNGLIWAYHWLQIGLYEPLLAGRNRDERQSGIAATVTRFRQMIEQPPTRMPRVMPMTPAVAPLFTARYPEAAIIFDNLHSMHDVISDILANPSVPRDRKRAEILKAAARYRDNTSFVTTPREWREMATMMGVQNMGGPVMGFLSAFPTPTVERGAVMTHSGMQHGPAHDSSVMKGMDHSKMPADANATSSAAPASSALHNHAEPATKAVTISRKPAAKAATTKKSIARKPAVKKRPINTTKSKTSRPAVKAKPKPKPDPMAGMDHSKHAPPKK